ncbi:MAG: hypothetical protein Aureis2KO_28420 [Aureisphaera sp.]
MKNIFKFLMIAMVVLAGSSCEDSDLIIDEVLDSVDTETGAIVRTIESPAELVTANNPDNNNIAMVLEVQQGNGSFVPDFKEVRVYVKLWEDQDLTTPVTDGAGNDVAEVLVTTLPSSQFTIDSNGLPRTSVEFPTQFILDAYPADAQITVPSFIALRLELEMSNGNIFTDTNVGATISGGIYFNAPFLYRIIFLNI